MTNGIIHSKGNTQSGGMNYAEYNRTSLSAVVLIIFEERSYYISLCPYLTIYIIILRFWRTQDFQE